MECQGLQLYYEKASLQVFSCIFYEILLEQPATLCNICERLLLVLVMLVPMENIATAMAQQMHFLNSIERSSRSEVFLRKGVLKMCCKFTGEYPCRRAISIKFL